jgi:hypothetical protein
MRRRRLVRGGDRDHVGLGGIPVVNGRATDRAEVHAPLLAVRVGKAHILRRLVADLDVLPREASLKADALPVRCWQARQWHTRSAMPNTSAGPPLDNPAAIP